MSKSKPVSLLSYFLIFVFTGGFVKSAVLGQSVFKNQQSTQSVDNLYSPLCESDLTQVHSYGQAVRSPNPDLKVFVWNVKKFEDQKAFRDLGKHAKQADIVFIQEAAHSTAVQEILMATLPSAQHSFYASFCDSDNTAFGVQIATTLVTKETRRWPSPSAEPFSTIHKMSGYSLVEWNGETIHLINTHALNFNPGGKFKEQIDDLIEKLQNLEGPMIWAGDFNTWISSRRDYLFSRTEELGLTHVLPKNDNRKLKLDHVFYRGLKLKSARIIELKTSDHFAISVDFEKAPAVLAY